MSTKSPRRRRALILASVSAGAILVAGSISLPALAETSETQAVSHHGYEIDVPASWDVVDLNAAPNACVRFDTPTVYLGTPGSQSDCPSQVVGRTAGIVISPLEESMDAAGSHTAAVTTQDGISEAKSVNHSIQVAAEDAGVLVSAAHNSTTESDVRTALDSARLVDGAQPTSLESPADVTTNADPIVAPGTLNDEAFDACTAQEQATMDAWQESPYKAVGIYTSGINRGCTQDNLTADWVAAQHEAGWQFILTDVGLQAPCSTRYDELISEDPDTARQQGADGAADGIAAATDLGFGAGSAIYADIEAYEGNEACTNAVLEYVSGWTEHLNSEGWLGGMYSSGSSGVSDLCANYDNDAYTMPDHLWFAWWNGEADTDSGEYCSNDYFADGQRIHQYVGETTETHGGVTVEIDRNFMDVKAGA